MSSTVPASNLSTKNSALAKAFREFVLGKSSVLGTIRPYVEADRLREESTFVLEGLKSNYNIAVNTINQVIGDVHGTYLPKSFCGLLALSDTGSVLWSRNVRGLGFAVLLHPNFRDGTIQVSYRLLEAGRVSKQVGPFPAAHSPSNKDIVQLRESFIDRSKISIRAKEAPGGSIQVPAEPQAALTFLLDHKDIISIEVGRSILFTAMQADPFQAYQSLVTLVGSKHIGHALEVAKCIEYQQGKRGRSLSRKQPYTLAEKVEGYLNSVTPGEPRGRIFHASRYLAQNDSFDVERRAACFEKLAQGPFLVDALWGFVHLVRADHKVFSSLEAFFNANTSKVFQAERLKRLEGRQLEALKSIPGTHAVAILVLECLPPKPNQNLAPAMIAALKEDPVKNHLIIPAIIHLTMVAEYRRELSEALAKILNPRSEASQEARKKYCLLLQNEPRLLDKNLRDSLQEIVGNRQDLSMVKCAQKLLDTLEGNASSSI
jgi:hypothetical protein